MANRIACLLVAATMIVSVATQAQTLAPRSPLAPAASATVNVPPVTAGIAASNSAVTMSYDGSQWSIPYMEIVYVGVGALAGAVLVDVAVMESLVSVGAVVGGWIGYKYYVGKVAAKT